MMKEGVERRIGEIIPGKHLFIAFIRIRFGPASRSSFIGILHSYLLGPSASSTHGNQTIKDALAPLSSPAINAHLVILLFDAVLLTLFPEMGVQHAAVAGSTEESNDSPLTGDGSGSADGEVDSEEGMSRSGSESPGAGLTLEEIQSSL
jgi:hypothetical protein